MRKGFLDTPKHTSLPESGDGQKHSDSQGSDLTSHYGRGRARALHFPVLGKDWVSKMRGTFGLTGTNSSLSADLQFCLGRRLVARMAEYGSPEYELTWKHWDMQSGAPICALRASAHHTSGKDCIGDQLGWPTPTVWSAPMSNLNWESFRNNHLKKNDGRKHQTDLQICTIAVLTGWKTPQKRDWKGPQGRWYKDGNADLPAQAKLMGWSTSTTRDHKDGTEKSCKNVPENSLLGRQVHQSHVEMGNTEGYLLNPLFSLWLMGFRKEWLLSVDLAMQSSHSSRQNSSYLSLKHVKTLVSSAINPRKLRKGGDRN